MIVALGADIDIGVILRLELVRGGEEIIVGRGNRVAQLVGVLNPAQHIGPHMLAVRIMAGRADNPNVCLPSRQRLPLHQAQASRPGMAPATAADAVRGVHVFSHHRVRAGAPLLENRDAAGRSGMWRMSSAAMSVCLKIFWPCGSWQVAQATPLIALPTRNGSCLVGIGVALGTTVDEVRRVRASTLSGVSAGAPFFETRMLRSRVALGAGSAGQSRVPGRAHRIVRIGRVVRRWAVAALAFHPIHPVTIVHHGLVQGAMALDAGLRTGGLRRG